MKVISCVIVVALMIFKKVSGDYEQFDESAWMDNAARDKYFEYSDIATPIVKYEPQNYSGNIDTVQFVASKPRTQSSRHFRENSNFNVVDFFLKAIRTTVSSNEIIRPENETTKGLDFKLSSSAADVTPTFGNHQDLQLILMGTKWCGAGNIAKDNQDIGYFYLIDACCRKHDLCPMALGAEQSNYGLKNSGKFTRSHCDCDDEFYHCLKSVNTFVSNQIGIVYFNVLGPECFKEDYPRSCLKHKHNRCIKYKSEESQPKRFQWIDNKWF